VRAALLRTGDEEADAHYTLRDILSTVARIAGISLRFRLALVASSDAVSHVYAMIRQELLALGCDARLFRAETEAERWLRGTDAPARRASRKVALA
jgi:putative aminopeptidase FrvX